MIAMPMNRLKKDGCSTRGMPMTRKIVMIVFAALSPAVMAFFGDAPPVTKQGDLTRVVLREDVASVGEVRICCNDSGSWCFESKPVTTSGCDVIEIKLTSPTEEAPPPFDIQFEMSGRRVRHVWTSHADRPRLWPQDWGRAPCHSQLAEDIPIAVALDGMGSNRLLIACSEPFERVDFGLTTEERTCRLFGRFRFFRQYSAPRSVYRVLVRLDARDVFWSDAVSEASQWISETAGIRDTPPPEAAFEPLYSTWYAFQQDVRADVLEREFVLASALGMKTAILDDGWQTDGERSDYSSTGDWTPVPSRFPDMKAHVAAAHAAGLKYMLWRAGPFVGSESVAWHRFKHMALRVETPDRAVLDPRFPEVRKYLVSVYERCLKEWDFDGLKLDFIDEFSFKGTDPAVKDGYAGRDFKSLPEATDRLMKDVIAHLKAIKPDVLVEFRQWYSGPAIRQYGNMLRAMDCPNDPTTNRKRIADLRLVSGRTAVHSDMLVWSLDSSPEEAAISVLNALFAVVQYSMVLESLPEDHASMIRNWIRFSNVHRESLLRGKFRGYNPESGYSALSSETSSECVAVAYQPLFPVPIEGSRRLHLINATDAAGLVVELMRVPRVMRFFDTCGNEVNPKYDKECGLVRLPVPRCGRVEMEF